jgi:hypothetical protein
LSSYLANLNIHYVGIKLIVRISSSLQRHWAIWSLMTVRSEFL